MTLIEYMLLAILGAVATYFVIKLIKPYAIRLGLVDVPEGRKNHSVATPLVGGIGMFLVFALATLFLPSLPSNIDVLFLSILLVLLMGVLDDLRDIPPGPRFLVQIFSSLALVVVAGVQVEHLGDLFGAGVIGTSVLAVPFTIVCFVGVMNAFNMIDGLDGLAGGVALVSTLGFALLAVGTGKFAHVGLMLALVSVLVGFLLKNMRTPWRPSAAVFMGDAGSMVLGLLMTYFAIEITGHRQSSVSPIVAVWVIALPLLDMATVMVRRLKAGRSPFDADDLHLHHLLRRANLSVARVVAVMLCLHLALASVGIAAWHYGVPDYLLFYGFMLLLVAYYVVTGLAGKRLGGFARANPGPSAH